MGSMKLEGAATRRVRRTLPPKWRKLVLTIHVIASVAWIGASLCLLTLGLTGVLSTDQQTQKAAYIALGTIGTTVTVPVAIAALVSGVVISVGTKWGLVRYWWTLISLVATAVMTAAVVFALAPGMRAAAANAAATPPGASVLDAVGDEAASVIAAPCVATVALGVVTAINVYKPWGRIRRS